MASSREMWGQGHAVDGAILTHPSPSASGKRGRHFLFLGISRRLFEFKEPHLAPWQLLSGFVSDGDEVFHDVGQVAVPGCRAEGIVEVAVDGEEAGVGGGGFGVGGVDSVFDAGHFDLGFLGGFVHTSYYGTEDGAT